MTLVQLLPLLLLRYVGTVDGPSHVLTATILSDYGDPASNYREYYRIDTFPSPNLLTEILLTAMVSVLPQLTAEKILVLVYLVAFPIAFRYLVRMIQPDATWVSYAAFPLASSFLFWFGFYNFVYGLVLFFVGAAFLLKPGNGVAGRPSLLLGLLLLVAYLTHLIPLVMLLVLAACVRGREVLSVLRAPGAVGLRRRDALRTLLWSGLSVLPVMVLVLAFLSRPSAGDTERKPLIELVLQLPTLVLPLVTYSPVEIGVALLLSLTLALLTLLKVRSHGRRAFEGRQGAVIAAATAAVVACLVVPDKLGQGGLITTRLSYFPPLLMLVWLACWQPPRMARLAAIGVWLGATLVLMSVRLPEQLRYDEYLQAFADASRVVRPESTLVGLQMREEQPPVTRLRKTIEPIRHGPSLVAALTNSVDVGHYEAITNYFPTQFRPDNNPRERIDPSLIGLELAPPDVDLLRASNSPGGLVDCVLVCGQAHHASEPQTRQRRQRLQDELDEAYVLVDRFGPEQQLAVYRKRSP